MNCVSETIKKMIEALPESLHERVLEEIKPIILEALDEAERQMQFERNKESMIAIARKVKEEIKEHIWSIRVSLGYRAFGIYEVDTVT